MNILKINKDKLKELCEKFHVERLYLVGSAAKDTLTEESDVDFLVKFKPFDLYYYFDNYLDFQNKLQELFQRKVDLVEEQSLRNPILIKSINRNKKLVYG